MKYIACCSGGKDSVATVILAHENNEPLDEIVFAEVMFSRNISGELPEHIDFINNVLFPKFNEWGYKTKIVRSGETMIDWFFHRVENPYKDKSRKGKLTGFPMRYGCVMNAHGKIKAIKKYTSELGEHIEYVGIAIDEPVRLERSKSKGNISLLEKYGYTEQMAFDLCKQYNLLSPIYEFSKRGGCWFCPNQSKSETRNLYFNHRDLFNLAMWLETLPDEFVIKSKDGMRKGMLDRKTLLADLVKKFESEGDNNV